MEYPEMYYLWWWVGKPSAVIKFTPEKDLSGAWFIDKSKPWSIWARDKNVKIFFEKTVPGGMPLNRRSMTEDKHKFINWIFAGEPKR